MFSLLLMVISWYCLDGIKRAGKLWRCSNRIFKYISFFLYESSFIINNNIINNFCCILFFLIYYNPLSKCQEGNKGNRYYLYGNWLIVFPNIWHYTTDVFPSVRPSIRQCTADDCVQPTSSGGQGSSYRPGVKVVSRGSGGEMSQTRKQHWAGEWRWTG